MNVTNAVLLVLIRIVPMNVVEVVGVGVALVEAEVAVGGMVTREGEDLGTMMEGEVMTITVEGVDLVTMMVEGVMIIIVEGVVVMMVEVVHIEVIKVEKMVATVKFPLLMPNLMVVLVEASHPLTVLMVGMQVMELMQFLHLQAILADLIPILHRMGVMSEVMGEIIKGMDGVVVDLGLLLGLTIVMVLVIEVDLVGLLPSPQLQ